jgi:hypothetical protein
MSDADVAVPPAAATEAPESSNLPVAPPAAATVNGVSDEAPVTDSQAATGNVGGLDVGAPRIEITEDDQHKQSNPENFSVAGDVRSDDFPSASKLGKLEVKMSSWMTDVSPVAFIAKCSMLEPR